jgi:hypothetical protein
MKKAGARSERVEWILDAGTMGSRDRLARELALAAQWRRDRGSRLDSAIGEQIDELVGSVYGIP